MATTRFSRRNFITHSTMACAVLAAGGSLLSGCASLPVVKINPENKKLDVLLASFGESKSIIVRSPKMDWDILLVKDADNYKAVEMKCTHHDNPLVASTTGLHCTDHGSRFDNLGKVLEGPADKNLKTFRTTHTDTTITIFLA